VVETALPHVADVHVRTLPDGLEPLEHLDGIGAVLLRPVDLGEAVRLGRFQGALLRSSLKASRYLDARRIYQRRGVAARGDAANKPS
jgi:hypothetical protein